jgi:hypothetical protein
VASSSQQQQQRGRRTVQLKLPLWTRRGSLSVWFRTSGTKLTNQRIAGRSRRKRTFS